MKSIIQEASSIAKAIQKSWEKAGRPKEFSIKVLEEEEKNFLGMTKKPAKIAIFFEDIKVLYTRKKPPFISKQTIDTKKPEQTYTKPQGHPETKELTPRKIRESLWTEDMVKEANKWMRGLLLQLNMPHVKFKTTKTRLNLKVHFSSPIIKDKNKQRQLFGNLSYLLMQTIRNKFKKTLMNLKAVLTSQ